MRTSPTAVSRTLSLLCSILVAPTFAACAVAPTAELEEETAETSSALGFAGMELAPADYDGDGLTDLGVKTTDGRWLIDFASDGFLDWNLSVSGYGGSTSHAVPADYDGDGKADISVKNDFGGWLIDFASNGFGTWDRIYERYGDASSIPVPADYDGDGKADLSIKNGLGDWHIDYASDGFGFWNVTYRAYGDASSIPVPADYDGDGKADLSVKNGLGEWFIDYASTGFGTWDVRLEKWGNISARPVPADYDGDRRADPAVKTDGGGWLADYADLGFGSYGLSTANRGSISSRPIPGDYDGDGKADLAVLTDTQLKIDFAKNGFVGWERIVSKSPTSAVVPVPEGSMVCGQWQAASGGGSLSAAGGQPASPPVGLSTLPDWAHACSTTRFFVKTLSGTCANVPAAGGQWVGEELFPGAPGSMCKYGWSGASTPAYAALAGVAAELKEVLHQLVNRAPYIRQDCRSESSTCAAGGAGCASGAAPQVRVCSIPEPPLGSIPQVIPRCDACGNVFTGKMNVVLPAIWVKPYARTFLAQQNPLGTTGLNPQVQFTVPANAQLLVVPGVALPNGPMGYMGPKL